MASKQVIVIRKDLSMRKGKMCAQACHASLGVLLSMMAWPGDGSNTAVYAGTYEINCWLAGLQTKICVGVDSEQELLDLYQKARDLGFPCHLVTDAGLTEFGGVPTKTCCAIGPALADKIDKITGHLKLL